MAERPAQGQGALRPNGSGGTRMDGPMTRCGAVSQAGARIDVAGVVKPGRRKAPERMKEKEGW